MVVLNRRCITILLKETRGPVTGLVILGSRVPRTCSPIGINVRGDSLSSDTGNPTHSNFFLKFIVTRSFVAVNLIRSRTSQQTL